MSAAQDMSVAAVGATLDTTRLGGAPHDGDFARLLQAASQPAAHRLHRTVQTLPEIEPTAGSARGTMRAHPGTGARDSNTLTDGVFGHASASGHSDAGTHAMVPTGASRPVVLRAEEAVMEPAGTQPTVTDASLQAGASALQAGSGMLQRWSRKPPKDRAVSALFFVAALWIGLAILGQLVTQFEDHAGLLILLGIGAFLFFGRRARRAQTHTGSTPT